MNGEQTGYYLSGDQVINETQNGTESASNIIAGGIIGRITGGSTYMMLKNDHGDVVGLTADGEVKADYTYSAYGEQIEGENSGISNPIRYAGEYTDDETGLIYLRARYYDPSMGRFISEDTHWNPSNMIYGDKEYKEGEIKVPNLSSILQSGNLYSYCSGNPINRYDRTGNEWASLRELAASLADIYGGDYTFHINQNSAYLVMGGGYTRIDGTFWYDGDVYMRDTGQYESVAYNDNGSLHMQRTDFYRAMGVNYEMGQISFRVTPEAKLLQSVLVGKITSYIFDGDIVSGFIAGLIDNMFSREVGDYWVRTTTAYRYDPMGEWYDTITTYEVYFKSPYYDYFTEEPIEILHYYLRVADL